MNNKQHTHYFAVLCMLQLKGLVTLTRRTFARANNISTCSLLKFGILFGQIRAIPTA
jgi:hypothetical protein